MKRNKMFSLVIAMFLVASLMIIPTIANATVDANNVTIRRIGADPRFQGAMVVLIDPSGINWTGPRQFYLSSTLGNQGLATLLTAYSLGKKLWVRIAGDASPGSLVEIIFIND